MRIFLRHWYLILSILFSFPVIAQSSLTDGVLINAESMDRDSVKRTVRLDGKVQVVFQGQHISCDHAVLNLKNSTIEATGNVVLTNDSVHIEGTRIVFNYKKNTGLIYEGFVQSDQVVFEGAVIEKIGEQKYIASGAEFTACTTCPPAWSFSGRKIEAELGGYARISRPIFRIAGFPIMILPGIIVPLKSSRQTGLLVPSWSSSKIGGLAVSESFFWAIDRNQDLTLTARNYEFRGFKGLAEYRYVLSENSKGALSGAAIQDRRLENVPKSFTRWFVNYDHHYEMPGEYIHRANLRGVSDLRYLRDFPDEVQGYGDPAIENKVSITKNSEDSSLSAEVGIYNNLLKSNGLANNDDAVHRFPEIKYSLKETQVFQGWGPWLRLDLDFVKFSRDRYSYDDLKFLGTERVPNSSNGDIGPGGEIPRDGSFEFSNQCRGKDPVSGAECDFIRTGQRADIQPTLSYPFQIWKTLDVLPLVKFRETQYNFDVPKQAEENGFPASAARRYVETQIAVKTEINRIFGDLSDPKSKRWKHSIQPEVSYSRIPWSRQPRHDFFGDFSNEPFARIDEPISNADINNPLHGLQFDYNDRTFTKNVTNLSLTNFLTRKLWAADEPNYRTVAMFRLDQSYDFYEAQAQTPQPWSPIRGLLNIRLDKFETYSTAAYNPYAKITNSSSRIKYLLTPENFLQLSYSRNMLVNADNQQLPDSKTENIGVGSGIDTKYFSFLGQLDYSNITFKIRSWKYELAIRPPGECWVIRFRHEQILGGDPTIFGTLDFDFGGTKNSKKL